MKKDPLMMVTSLLYKLNLLESETEFNIHQFKTMQELSLHWTTIHKYLRIITYIQKYCPLIDLDESKFTIKEPKVFNYFNLKEQFVIHLYNNGARNTETAIPLPTKYNFDFVLESIGYIYEKTEENNFYLNPYGVELYKTLKTMISDLIFNEKEIKDVFDYTEEDEIKEEEEETKRKILSVPM